jgi:hypothetical protein
VPGPRPVPDGVPGPGVDFDGPLPVRPRRGHGDLQLYLAVSGENERCLQGQLLDLTAADGVPGPHRQLHERGRREQHAPGHRMIGQPRMRPQRHPPG